MLSKISNTASKESIEQILQAKFDYGYLYKPRSIIDGHKESALCIVTSEARDRIQYGIWGILPKGYKDNWATFQSIYNTLEIEFETISEISWLYEALKHRRCLIIATGYFTSEIKNQSLKTFINVTENKSLFCFAGIYNILEDGFISCSILTHTRGSSKYFLNNPKPIIIKKENYSDYLQILNIKIWNRNFELNPNEILKSIITNPEHQK
ncbi:MAG: SOS response-associated peptidase family protein [Gelidibacter sp.]